MRSLLILRHAKSAWDPDDPVADELRPLAPRGAKAASVIGRFLRGAGALPDAAVCSPALRTTTTLGIAMAKGGWACRVRRAQGLYLGGVEGLLSEVRSEDDASLRLLVVSHQPTCSQSVALLTGGRVAFPTAALASIDLDVEHWRDVEVGVGMLRWLVTPRIVSKKAARSSTSDE